MGAFQDTQGHLTIIKYMIKQIIQIYYLVESLGLVRKLKVFIFSFEVSSAHPGCSYLIKNTVKTWKIITI